MFNFSKKQSRHDELVQVKKFLKDHLLQLEKRESGIPRDVFDVTRFFFEEVIDMYESMDILIQKDHFRGCISIARSILENSINLQYIYKEDTEKRASNFKLAAVSSLLKRSKDVEGDQEQLVEIKKFLESQIQEYMFDGRTLRDRAKEVGSESIYKSAYKRLSEYVHGEYKPTHARDLTTERPYNSYLKRLVFSDTVLVTLQAIQRVCERYDLDGGVMIIDDLGYKGTIFFHTNPKRVEQENSEITTSN